MSEVKKVVVLLRRAQLPVYRKIFKEISPFSLFCHPRMTGKSYNVVLGVMAHAIERGQNICFARQWEESLADSLWREVVDKIHSLALSEFFHVTRARITFKPTGVVFFFRALSNPESIKGLQGVSILHIDEVQQIRQETMQLVVPSIRGKERLIVLTGNLPVSGREHWIYKSFYENPLVSYRTFEVQQADNTLAFPTSESLSQWREEQRVFFRGRQEAYEREILGKWLSRCTHAIFPRVVESEKKGGEPQLWLYNYDSGRMIWLGVSLLEEGVSIVRESLDNLPVKFNRSTPIWLSREHKLALATFRACGFRLRLVSPASLEDLALSFSGRDLILSSEIVVLKEELLLLSWQGEGETTRAPQLGLGAGALALLVGGKTL